MTDPRWCNPMDTFYELADSEDDGSLIDMTGIIAIPLPLMSLNELYGPCEGHDDGLDLIPDGPYQPRYLTADFLRSCGEGTDDSA